MIRSMTGFGRAILSDQSGKLTVEITAVNRKYLEIFISSPREFVQFEHVVRKWVGDRATRGQISVRIYFVPAKMEGILPEPAVLRTLKRDWDRLADEAGIDSKEVTLTFLTQYLPTRPQESSDEELFALKTCVHEAIESLMAMKLAEGKALSADLTFRIQELEKMIGEIEKHAPDATEKMRAKLFEKMQEALRSTPDLEERLLREIALFAERVDITEEITRFRSHIEQFKGFLKGDIVGRKMDFLLQEMGREVNTIGSKAMEAKISHTVVAMKSELEKIREQVQNIE